MLRKLLLATTVIVVSSGIASAADLPRRAAPPVFVPVPVFTWTGFYAGINAGYGFDVGNKSNRYDLPAASVLNSFGKNGVLIAPGLNEREGFVGGAQIGYNYQFTPGSGVVVGVEADAQYSDFGKSTRTIIATYSGDNTPTQNNPHRVLNDRLNYFGTVRGRLGYAFDRVLFYGTGGFAYGEGRIGGDDFRTGYAAGGGIEYAMPVDSFLNFFRSSAVTLKVEGLYVHLDKDNAVRGRSVFNPATITATFNAPARESEFVVARAGLNYKFGSY
ncbi:outer membrane protein [Methylobacterium sp. E-045]|uniref:outer membrane protein n=1 Tax=Methylobacterium sp. E-045 TaxID=2836575 RepID=UPI001FBABD0A|nr:porin family protein [Methylobacterium sp. E-045]MCJ2131031.1 porin family protein [Methylobacterium sp. E-045]